MANEDQARQWSGSMGRNWVDRQADLDALLAEPLNLLMRHAGLRHGERVLDIGCGTGASTLRAADEVGPSGEVLGIDISPLMVERAQERADEALAEHVAFQVCDAETEAFGPDRFDRALSRFGVMFFSNPVAAFSNIARAIRPGGTISFIAWGGREENPWFSIPERVALAHFRAMPERGDPRAPGPMAFSDRDYATGLMREAGLAEVEAHPHDLMLTPPGGLAEAAALATRVGPAARLIRDHDGTEDDRLAIEDDVAEALAAFEQDGRILVPAVISRFAAVRGK